MEPKSNPLVSIEHLSFRYDVEWVLEDINLCIYHSDFLAIIGPNGGGKTTLIKLVLGLLHPRQGIIQYERTTLGSQLENIGYVPQISEYDKRFPLRVLDVCLMGLLHRKKMFRPFAKTDIEKAEAALEKVNLQDFRHRHLYELSGGQIQRLFIARSLVDNPALLLLDEPTNFIDKPSQESLGELILQWSETIAIVIVTHDVGFVPQAVKNIACVNRTLHYHKGGELMQEDMDQLYGHSVEMVTHGVSRRVLKDHCEGNRTLPERETDG
jgi:zinc transport system ATP-binding protein